MGFANRIGTRFPSQESIASIGGLAFILQLPPPEQPAPPSSQHVLMLLLALALFLTFVWLLLPKKCRKFCIEKGRHE